MSERQVQEKRCETVADLKSALAHRFPTAFRGHSVMPGGADLESTIPTGAVTEVVGTPGSGGCTLVLQWIARVLKEGSQYAAFIDLTGEFYPPAAAALGVPLHRFLLIRAGDLRGAWRLVEVMLQGGAIPLIVVDLPSGTRPISLSTYHRLRRRVRASGGALVVLSRSSVFPADRRIKLS